MEPGDQETAEVTEQDLAPPVDEEPTRLWLQEVMRAVLALVFAFFFLLVIVWGFINVRGGEQVWMQTKELLDSLIPAVTALIGSAVGFYFGT